MGNFLKAKRMFLRRTGLCFGAIRGGGGGGGRKGGGGRTKESDQQGQTVLRECAGAVRSAGSP